MGLAKSSYHRGATRARREWVRTKAEVVQAKVQDRWIKKSFVEGTYAGSPLRKSGRSLTAIPLLELNKALCTCMNLSTTLPPPPPRPPTTTTTTLAPLFRPASEVEDEDEEEEEEEEDLAPFRRKRK